MKAIMPTGIAVQGVTLGILALFLSFPVQLAEAASMTFTSDTTIATDQIIDFNGDGYEDLAIGVLGEQIGTADNAGAVSIIYGSSLGLSATTIPDQGWHQDRPSVEDMVENSDNFGNRL